MDLFIEKKKMQVRLFWIPAPDIKSWWYQNHMYALEKMFRTASLIGPTGDALTYSVIMFSPSSQCLSCQVTSKMDALAAVKCCHCNLCLSLLLLSSPYHDIECMCENSTSQKSSFGSDVATPMYATQKNFSQHEDPAAKAQEGLFISKSYLFGGRSLRLIFLLYTFYPLLIIYLILVKIHETIVCKIILFLKLMKQYSYIKRRP